ncbi:hypothetical protein [Armatimonas sp.]|uniref:hypothetical protein n=1 Tax=Armatimonas sp. TaxID=1872638 RepID=UPI00374D5E07
MSFNDSRVVAALNSLSVPVYLANDMLAGEEKAALQAIHREGFAKKLSVGTVHCFLLAPDGALLDTIHVAQATPQRIMAMIEREATAQKIHSGKPLVLPLAPPLPPTPKNGLRLHVVARYLEKKPDGSLGLISGAGGNWSALPGEDWPLFDAAAARALLAGERSVAERLLTHFYPPTENNDLSKNVFEALEWKAEAQPAGTIRLSGSLTLKHSFYSRDDDRRVSADFVGYAKGAQLTLVTTRASYNNQPFAVAVQSV